METVAPFARVVIVGVGLLGGSIGLGLRKRRLAKKVVGYSPRGSSLSQAKEVGAIDEIAKNLAEACNCADVVVICTPVQSIVELVAQSYAVMPKGGLITDVGSTKMTIVDGVSALPASASFCGSHPMAGSEKSGVEFARENLLDGKLVLVTPHPSQPPALAQRTSQFWQSLGARTQIMSAAEHDAAVARVSHLPHLLASALAGATPTDLLPLAASGWCDTTRVASGGAQLWRQILEENRPSVLQALEEFSGALQEWLTALKNNDATRLEQLLIEGKQKRDALGN